MKQYYCTHCRLLIPHTRFEVFWRGGIWHSKCIREVEKKEAELERKKTKHDMSNL